MRMIKYQGAHVYGIVPGGTAELSELPGVLWTATVQGHLASADIPPELAGVAEAPEEGTAHFLNSIGFAQFVSGA